MCAIIRLMPKQMISKEALYNACHNNWHSFGLVTKVDGKLDIYRDVPESGEIDPDKVYKMLQADFEYERYLHVRHNTAGATNLENTHPFDVLFDEKTGNHLVFMHNGTLYEYKSKKKSESGAMVDDDDGPSDTKNFTDEVLVPSCLADFGSGVGDIKNPFFVKTMNKFWPGAGNRGVLISSKSDPLFLGSWVEVGEDGNKILASNNDYFEKVTRGPEFIRRRLREEEEKKRLEEKLAAKKSKTSIICVGEKSNSTTLAALKDHKVESVVDHFSLTESLKNIFGDWDVWDREGMVALGLATRQELEGLYDDRTTCLCIMDAVFTEFAKMHGDLEKEREKRFKAEKQIEKFSNELRSLKSEKSERGVA